MTQEVRLRQENIEKELLELKRQQSDLVEASIKLMFDLSSMVEKEKAHMAHLAEGNSKLEKF